ncbi:hypothetical protein CFE70_008183 [Pyrenophora teres f. teres 0-1]|uniref:Uncharacterized protein n=2 Tax=Pyrenophora teres f. teres TaxID=97479 RepID=E3S501_PYRTT|nr:hypothetical protein PTT_17677 [Pyrenophora teres f. teres 0-1]KAE8828898.1 hypothetical protein PTNB85_08086 [Pyrenophora teres f. teres]KAE8830059.1 hypothetical protein HRS9139_06683 [Pyrenophora teres f. teres]KAE8841601.1 hypothetical protein HRS9122_05727 [Pyrenophora teres f. teres]KAE8859704.1 hypothetical protein PTNB29_06935 [Pyrenophora teres f. teres]
MGRVKRYNRDELLGILEDQCPDALANFPKSDSFIFNTTEDDGDKSKTYLRIGRVLVETKKDYSLSLGDEAWVEITGPCKPWLYVQTIDHGCVDEKIYRHVRCDGVFGALTESANVYAWSDFMKALISFAFVYAGRRDTYADFDKGQGLPILVKALKDIAAHDQAVKNKGNNSPAPSSEENEMPQAIPEEEAALDENKILGNSDSANDKKSIQDHDVGKATKKRHLSVDPGINKTTKKRRPG